ncbi:ABC transporter ATP-binding protein [Paenibacillus sp. 1P07SE]|uniref:ABC transporter ATP-binding protein n=1 Tax=Paenibacillus sp. 1P07SE TaxID=3132209 RepID=UPI0039A53F0A
MRRTGAFLKPYTWIIIAALLLMLVELVVELWHPLLLAQVIDDGIMAGDTDAVIRLGGWMVGIALAGFAAGIINSYLAAHVSQGFGYDIRKRMFGTIQTLSFAGFSRFSTATLITRLTSDVTQLQNLVFMGLRIMMRAPLMMAGGLVLSFMVNARLALILLIVTPVLFGLLIWIMNRAFRMFQHVQERLDQTNGVLRENLGGMRLIRAFVRKGYEITRFARANTELRERTVSALRTVELTLPLMLLVMNLSILVILWAGQDAVRASGIEVGEVVAIINYATRITGAFHVISFILTGLSRARASGRRVEEVLAAEPDITDSEQADPSRKVTRGELAFEGVTFRYPGSQAPILQDLTFTVKAGQTAAILGATGSGKSSLFQLIPRLYDTDAGTIRIDGREIRQYTLEQLRRAIGYVPQEALLFTGTVEQNLRWGKEEATAEEIRQAASDAQIHDTIRGLPSGYETMLGQKGVNLSGGQKQRLSIARALIRRPRLLMLDDSTSALDARTEAKLMDALAGYPCTTLLITQKISTAMEADTILLLEDGRLLAQGTHEELLRTTPLYRQIVESQSEQEVAT